MSDSDTSYTWGWAGETSEDPEMKRHSQHFLLDPDREAGGRRGLSRLIRSDRSRTRRHPRVLSIDWLFRPRPAGQAVVEFALIMPAMLFLMLMAIDFGRVFASYIEVMNASREAAAYAAGNPTDMTGIQAHAAREINVQSTAGESALTLTVTCTDQYGAAIPCAAAAGGAGSGSYVTVRAREQFAFITPIISSIFGGGIGLEASFSSVILVLASSGGAAPSSCTTEPTPSFTVSVENRTVMLDATASTPVTGVCAISGYNWEMGDGANPFPPVVGMTASYTYALSGTYTITLEVTNPAGYRTMAVDVTIGAPGPTPSPIPTLIPTPAPPPANPPPTCNTAPSFTYEFTGNGNGTKKHQMTFYGAYTGQPAPASWAWTFGDGHSGSDQTASRNYDEAGTYTVTLTVTNGSCVKTTTQTVVVP
jgi:PKD repeat protein